MIRFLALVFFCSSGAAFAQTPSPVPTATPSVVYAVSDPAAIQQYKADPEVVRSMVNRLVLAVTGEPDLARAWRSLVAPTDKIGIKISAAGGELFTTHRAVIEAIVAGLSAAGVSRRNVIVWDRQLSGTDEASSRRSGDGYQWMSIEPRDGYDEKATFSSPLIGKLVWGDLAYIPVHGESPLHSDTENTSEISHFAKIISNGVTKIINVPVMSDSNSAGLAGCLYNVTLPNIDNGRRFTQYGAIGAGGIAEIYADPMIGGKVVLNLMDGLIAAYAGGPEPHPNYARHEATLFASRDPVAIDTLALHRLEELRREAGLRPIGELAAHVEIAGRMGLGNADVARIERRDLNR